MRRLVGLAAALVVLASVGIAAVVWSRSAAPPPERAATPQVRPTLYCEFYNFMHSATVVAFNFAVSRAAGPDLTFTELSVAGPDGTTASDASNPPEWRYQMEDGAPVISAPDGETRIVLYGLKPNAAGVIWTEAGIRSNVYRNIEGKCRQAHLDQAGGKAEKPR